MLHCIRFVHLQKDDMRAWHVHVPHIAEKYDYLSLPVNEAGNQRTHGQPPPKAKRRRNKILLPHPDDISRYIHCHTTYQFYRAAIAPNANLHKSFYPQA